MIFRRPSDSEWPITAQKPSVTYTVEYPLLHGTQCTPYPGFHSTTRRLTSGYRGVFSPDIMAFVSECRDRRMITRDIVEDKRRRPHSVIELAQTYRRKTLIGGLRGSPSSALSNPVFDTSCIPIAGSGASNDDIAPNSLRMSFRPSPPWVRMAGTLPATGIGP